MDKISGKQISVIFFVLIMIFLYVLNVNGQQTDSLFIEPDETLTRLVEQITEDTETAHDYTSFIEEYHLDKQEQIHINRATPAELQYILKLDTIQINSLRQYIQSYGPLLTIYELYLIDGFDTATIIRICDRVSIDGSVHDPQISLKGMVSSARNQLFIRYGQILQKKSGYLIMDDSTATIDPSGYIGSPAHIYVRYDYNYLDRIRFGFTAEKDPGEPFFNKYQKSGFDFYSGYISIKKLWRIKSLIIGDFHTGYGEGLNLSTGFRLGGSSGIIVPNYKNGIRHSSSANEYNYLRGAAVNLEFGPTEFMLFVSSKKIGAKIYIDDSTEINSHYFSSFYQNGLHRTLDEREKKRTVTEKLFGGAILYKNRMFLGGVNFYKSMLDISLQPNDRVYNRFDLQGTQNFNLGVNFRLLLNKISFSGEASMSQNRGMAQIFNCYIKPNPIYTLRISFRNYQINYQNLYTNAFGKQGKNEWGIWLGLKAAVHKKINLILSTDHYKIPWLKSNISGPSDGADYYAQIDYKISRSASAYINWRYSLRSENNARTTIMDRIHEYAKHRIRLHFTYMVSPALTMKNRLEYIVNVSSGDKNARGFLMYHDIIYKPAEKKYAVIFRYAMFDTDSYYERIYAYENDVLYGFSIPAYYYKGYRVYILIRTTPVRNFDLWFKASHTIYANMDHVGTGLEQITGNNKTELKIQVRYRF